MEFSLINSTCSSITHLNTLLNYRFGLIDSGQAHNYGILTHKQYMFEHNLSKHTHKISIWTHKQWACA
jgi:hypothetical protein